MKTKAAKTRHYRRMMHAIGNKPKVIIVPKVRIKKPTKPVIPLKDILHAVEFKGFAKTDIWLPEKRTKKERKNVVSNNMEQRKDV